MPRDTAADAGSPFLSRRGVRIRFLRSCVGRESGVQSAIALTTNPTNAYVVEGGEVKRRWQVVVPGFLIGSGLSAFLGLLTIGKSDLMSSIRGLLLGFLVCVGPLGGPLAEPFAYVDFDPIRTIASASVLLALIVLHPLRPGIATGIISGIAIAVWFVWGLSMTYDGV